MNPRTIICTLGLFLAVVAFVEAGSGVNTGKLDYTMYLGDKSSCNADDECLQVCKDQAKDASLVKGARCMKFVGNIRKYCCCYGSSTNACCQSGNSGLDCVPSSA